MPRVRLIVSRSHCGPCMDDVRIGRPRMVCLDAKGTHKVYRRRELRHKVITAEKCPIFGVSRNVKGLATLECAVGLEILWYDGFQMIPMLRQRRLSFAAVHCVGYDVTKRYIVDVVARFDPQINIRPTLRNRKIPPQWQRTRVRYSQHRGHGGSLHLSFFGRRLPLLERVVLLHRLQK